MEAQLSEFNNILLVGNITAGLNLLSVITQFLFNFFSEQDLPRDLWTIVDCMNALTNMTIFTILNQLDSTYYLDKFYKDLIDYGFIMIIFASWGRFLTFFLVIESISLLLQTLVKMLADAKTFIIITCLYFLVSMSIFRALF